MLILSIAMLSYSKRDATPVQRWDRLPVHLISLPFSRLEFAVLQGFVRNYPNLCQGVAEAFFRSARTVTGRVPARVTSDGHDASPKASKTELGAAVRHRTNRYLNNHLEQDHRGIKQRTRPMGGFKSVESAKRFCRVHDEVQNFLRPRSRRNEVVSLAQRRLLYTARTRVLLTSLAAA
jgi:putative transposase